MSCSCPHPGSFDETASAGQAEHLGFWAGSYNPRPPWSRSCVRDSSGDEEHSQPLTGHAAPLQKFSEESLEFQRRISQRNGLSEETYLPPALHTLPPVVTMESAREEARMVLFGAVQDVLDRTGLPAYLPARPPHSLTLPAVALTRALARDSFA